MEVGRPVMGPTAALLNHCQMRSSPAIALLLYLLPGPSHDALSSLQPLWAFLHTTTGGACPLPDKKVALATCQSLMKKIGGGGSGGGGGDELLYA